MAGTNASGGDPRTTEQAMDRPEQHLEHEHGGLDDIHAELDTTPVHEAAREGRVDELRAILEADPAQATATDKYGLTPLHWAGDRGHAEAILLLLARGADVNAVEARLFKRRPLHFAALSGSRAAVDALLAADGVDVDVADYRGSTALHGAAHAGDAAVVRALLAAGADASRARNGRETPLHVAASEGHEEAARLLLAAGGAPLRLAADGVGLTAAEAARQRGHAHLASLLVASASQPCV